MYSIIYIIYHLTTDNGSNVINLLLIFTLINCYHIKNGVHVEIFLHETKSKGRKNSTVKIVALYNSSIYVFYFYNRKVKKNVARQLLILQSYLVSRNFSGFFVDGELCAFLIRLLDNRIFDLSVDAFVFVSRVHLCVIITYNFIISGI